MRDFTAFIRSRQFFMHLGLIIFTLSIIVLAVIYSLDSMTGHGEFVTVPDFTNQSILKLEEVRADADVEYKIVDSLYDPQEKPGIVLRQDPEAGSKVKHNRMVYLFVTGLVPPQVIMPKLTDLSERQARLIINSYGLKCGKSIEKNADCNGCVIDQMLGNNTILAGKPVKKGSVITLVVGKKGAFQLQSDDSLSVDSIPE